MVLSTPLESARMARYGDHGRRLGEKKAGFSARPRIAFGVAQRRRSWIEVKWGSPGALRGIAGKTARSADRKSGVSRRAPPLHFAIVDHREPPAGADDPDEHGR